MALSPKKNDEEVKIGGDTKDVETAFNRIKKAVDKLGAFVVRAGAGITAGLAGIFAVTLNAEGAANRLTRAIEKQGRASDGTTEALKRHAKAIQATSHFSGPAIQSAQALLVQMSNLRTEAMEPAIQAAAGMAAMLDTDLPQASEELAEALALPTEALSVLEKYGVFFNDTERKSIQLMVEKGQIAAVQDEILRRLTDATAGQAQATADGIGVLKQIKNQFAAVTTEVGKLLFDRLEPLLTTLYRLLRGLGENRSALETIAYVISLVIKAVVGLAVVVGVMKAFYALRTAVLLTTAAFRRFGRDGKKAVRGVLAASGVGLFLVALGLVYDGIVKLIDIGGSWSNAWKLTKNTIQMGTEFMLRAVTRLAKGWVKHAARVLGIFKKDNPAQRALDALDAGLDASFERVAKLEAENERIRREGDRIRAERESADFTKGKDFSGSGASETSGVFEQTSALSAQMAGEEKRMKQARKASQALFEERQRWDAMRIRAAEGSYLYEQAEQGRRNQEQLEAEQEQNQRLAAERNRALEEDRTFMAEYNQRQAENEQLRRELDFLGKQDWSNKELEFARSQLLTEEQIEEQSRNRRLKREISYRNTRQILASKHANFEMKLEALKGSHLYKTTMSTLGDIQGLQESGNKHLAEVGKAAARAELLLRLAVDPPAAFARTAAAFPAPWGTALGVAAAAGVATRLLSGLREIGGSSGSVPAFTPPPPLSTPVINTEAETPASTGDAPAEGEGEKQPIVVQVNLDKQVLAEAVADVQARADS